MQTSKSTLGSAAAPPAFPGCPLCGGRPGPLSLSPEPCRPGSPRRSGNKAGPRGSPAGQSGRTDYANAARSRSAGNTGPFVCSFSKPSSCAGSSPQTLRCHTNVTSAKHQILKTIQSEFISSLLGKGFSSSCDKLQTPDPLLPRAGGRGARGRELGK